jgi:hypothetical protein
MAFKRLDPEDFLLSADSITATIWTDYLPTLTTFFTSSAQELSTAGSYYLSVYQTASSLTGAEVQFDIVYGDKQGSGSVFYDPSVIGASPTRTIYGQYRNLVLGDENANFVFGNISASNFFAISIDRNRYKESLFPGSLTLSLNSGSNTIILTDDSRVTTTNVFTDAGRLYNLVSGSAGTVYTGVNSRGWAGGATAASGSYGWFLPDIGTLILNPLALAGAGADGGITLNVSRSYNSDGLNLRNLFKVISGSSVGGSSFTLNSQETVTSDYVFVRARNAEFNYSENPSFISGSTGAVLYDSFINNPQTYITTIGLYNDANELLAVAKLSRPFEKDFTREMLVRVKLDF